MLNWWRQRKMRWAVRHHGDSFLRLAVHQRRWERGARARLMESMFRITPATHGKTVRFCPRCRTLEPHYVCDPENANIAPGSNDDANV